MDSILTKQAESLESIEKTSNESLAAQQNQADIDEQALESSNEQTRGIGDMVDGLQALGKTLGDKLSTNLAKIAQEIGKQAKSLEGVEKLAANIGKEAKPSRLGEIISKLSLDNMKKEFLEATNVFGINDKRIAQDQFIKEQRALGATESTRELKQNFKGAFAAGTDIKKADAEIAKLREATGGKFSDDELARASEKNASLFERKNQAVARYAEFDRGAALKFVAPEVENAPLAPVSQAPSNDDLNVSEEEAESARARDEQTELLRKIEANTRTPIVAPATPAAPTPAADSNKPSSLMPEGLGSKASKATKAGKAAGAAGFLGKAKAFGASALKLGGAVLASPLALGALAVGGVAYAAKKGMDEKAEWNSFREREAAGEKLSQEEGVRYNELEQMFNPDGQIPPLPKKAAGSTAEPTPGKPAPNQSDAETARLNRQAVPVAAAPMTAAAPTSSGSPQKNNTSVTPPKQEVKPMYRNTVFTSYRPPVAVANKETATAAADNQKKIAAIAPAAAVAATPTTATPVQATPTTSEFVQTTSTKPDAAGNLVKTTTGSGMNIAGQPVGENLTPKQAAIIKYSLASGNTYPPDVMEKYERFNKDAASKASAPIQAAASPQPAAPVAESGSIFGNLFKQTQPAAPVVDLTTKQAGATPSPATGGANDPTRSPIFRQLQKKVDSGEMTPEQALDSIVKTTGGGTMNGGAGLIAAAEKQFMPQMKTTAATPQRADQGLTPPKTADTIYQASGENKQAEMQAAGGKSAPESIINSTNSTNINNNSNYVAPAPARNTESSFREYLRAKFRQ